MDIPRLLSDDVSAEYSGFTLAEGERIQEEIEDMIDYLASDDSGTQEAHEAATDRYNVLGMTEGNPTQDNRVGRIPEIEVQYGGVSISCLDSGAGEGSVTNVSYAARGTTVDDTDSNADICHSAIEKLALRSGSDQACDYVSPILPTLCTLPSCEPILAITPGDTLLEREESSEPPTELDHLRITELFFEGTSYEALHAVAKTEVYKDVHETSDQYFEPYDEPVSAYALKRNDPREKRFQCLVASCNAWFSSSTLRTQHVDRHFKPRIICPAFCGQWFHDMRTLKKHCVKDSPACSVYLKKGVTYQADPRWMRCPSHILRKPKKNDPLRTEFSAAMRFQGLVLEGEASYGTELPVPRQITGFPSEAGA